MSLSKFFKSKKKIEIKAILHDLGLNVDGNHKEIRHRAYLHYKNNPLIRPSGYDEWLAEEKRKSDEKKEKGLSTGDEGTGAVTPNPLLDLEFFGNSDDSEEEDQNASFGTPNNQTGAHTSKEDQNPLFSTPTNQAGRHALKDFVNDLSSALLTVVQNATGQANATVKQNQQQGIPKQDGKSIRSLLQEGRDRGILFTGKEDVNYFFKEIENIRRIIPITDDELFNIFPEFLSGPAKRFFTTHPDECSSYDDTKALFKKIYPSRLLKNQIKADMYDRKQVEHETIDDFIAVVRHMNSKLETPMKETDLLEDIILDNLHPKYLKMLRGIRIRTLEDLKYTCRKEEEIIRKTELYVPPPARLIDPYPDPPTYSRHRSRRDYYYSEDRRRSFSRDRRNHGDRHERDRGHYQSNRHRDFSRDGRSFSRDRENSRYYRNDREKDHRRPKSDRHRDFSSDSRSFSRDRGNSRYYRDDRDRDRRRHQPDRHRDSSRDSRSFSRDKANSHYDRDDRRRDDRKGDRTRDYRSWNRSTSRDSFRRKDSPYPRRESAEVSGVQVDEKRREKRSASRDRSSSAGRRQVNFEPKNETRK